MSLSNSVKMYLDMQTNNIKKAAFNSNTMMTTIFKHYNS